MPLSIPAELKKVTPYVRRAEELDKDKANAESRLVAYYCRQYAVHMGIGLATSPEGKNCLGELLNALEEEKVAMASFTRDEAKFLCRKFADKIFDKADLDDRTGDATKMTAKTFYAAASFLEILQQFYQDDDESEEVGELKKRAVYSKWKATDILKAVKEGREPTPGGYGEDAMSTELETEADGGETESTPAPKVETVEEENGQTEPDAPVIRLPSTEEEEGRPDDEGLEVELGPPPPAYEFAPPAPSAPPVAPPPKPPITFTAPPAPAPAPTPPVVKAMPPPQSVKKKAGFLGFGKKKSSKLSKAQFADCMELTKFALSALEDKDSDLAAERLKRALAMLER